MKGVIYIEVPRRTNNYLSHYLKNSVWIRGVKISMKKDLNRFFKESLYCHHKVIPEESEAI